MGLSNFLKNFREKQAKRKLAKLTRRLCERYAQDYDRMGAADELDRMEGEDAIFALLQRFQVQTPKIIEDEEEKKTIYDMVMAKGVLAISPLCRCIREKESLAYPLQLLRAIAGPEATRRYLLEALGACRPEYNRAPQKKIDLIRALTEFKGPDVISAITPFLQDPQDDVVLVTLENLAGQGTDEDRIRLLFIDILTMDEEKPRIKRRVAELLKELHWKVAGHRNKVEDHLPSGYYLDKKGFLKLQGEV